MSYVLGYFVADGAMIKNRRGAHFIEFSSVDRYLIEKVKEVLESSHTISERVKKKKHWKQVYRLQIGSKDMFEDLTNLGFSQNKSLTMTFPEIPPKYISDFVRGYFDGDGGVYFKKYQPKDRPNPRWVFQSRFISGSKVFLEELLSRIQQHGVKGGCIVQKQGGYEIILSHHDSVALFKLMYNNALDQIYLKRKFDVFTKAIETLYGGVAQLVEHPLVTRKVAGSSPVAPA